jgi:hypothetical protein
LQVERIRNQPEKPVGIPHCGEPLGREFLGDLGEQVGSHLGAGTRGESRWLLEGQPRRALHGRTQAVHQPRDRIGGGILGTSAAGRGDQQQAGEGERPQNPR